MKRLLHITALLLLPVLCASGAGENIDISVQANRTTIFADEFVLLTVRVSGVDPKTQPDLSQIKNCRIENLGSQGNSFSQISIINGRMTQNRHVGRDFAFKLYPNAPGQFTAGPVKMNIDGKDYIASGPTIQVTGVEKQDSVLIQVSASRETVLVDEPFEIKLSLAIRCLPTPHADRDPLDAANPPNLTVPFLFPAAPEGLSAEDLNALLPNYLVRRNDSSGFTMNGFTARRDPFDFESMFNFDDMMKSQDARFLFPRRLIHTNGMDYWEYTISRKYTPTTQGNYTFDPVSMKGMVIAGLTNDGQGALRQIFAIGPAVTVRVVPPPEEDRPESFIGAVGTNFIAEASLDTHTCRLGDPLTLSVTYSGNANLNNAFPPLFASLTNLTERFRVYDDTLQVTKEANRHSYTLTIRPTRAGTLEVPPMQFSYYDTTKRCYQTVTTDPIPLRVDFAEELQASNIINSAGINDPAQSSGSDIPDGYVAPLDPAMISIPSESISMNPQRLLLLASGPILYTLVVLSLASARLWTNRRKQHRKQRAAARAQSLLAKVRQDHDDRTTSALICNAIRQYISERLDLPMAGLTPEDIRTALHNLRVPQEAGSHLASLMERHFNADFTTESTRLDRLTDAQEAASLIGKLDAFFAANPETSREEFSP